MTVEVTQRPLYLTARTQVYDAWDFRNAMEHHSQGAGVVGREDFRVLQRQAGANLSVDIGATGVGRMRAWVRGSTRGGQGLYLVDNIDRNYPTLDQYLPQLNHPVAANSSGLPRVDAVVLQVLDQQHAGASNDAVVDIRAGTPTSGADADNRTGAVALPASCLHLADLLIPSGATSPSVIRDRRHTASLGRVPAALHSPSVYTLDGVVPRYTAATPVAQLDYVYTAISDVMNVGLIEIPCRIKVGFVRWGYQQVDAATTLVTGGYWWQFFDSSGRYLAGTGTGTIAGTSANPYVSHSDALTGGPAVVSNTWTIEPGMYYVAWSARGLGRSNATTNPRLRLFNAWQYSSLGLPGVAAYYSAAPGQVNHIEFTGVGGSAFIDASLSTVAPSIYPVIPSLMLTST